MSSFEVRSPVETDSPPQSFVTFGMLFYMRRDDYGDWLIAGPGPEIARELGVSLADVKAIIQDLERVATLGWATSRRRLRPTRYSA